MSRPVKRLDHNGEPIEKEKEKPAYVPIKSWTYAALFMLGRRLMILSANK